MTGCKRIFTFGPPDQWGPTSIRPCRRTFRIGSRGCPKSAAVDRFRAYEISYGGLPATLGGGDTAIAGRYGRRPFLSGADPRSVFPQLRRGENVIVSEAFANKHHMKRGDILSLPLGGRTAKLPCGRRLLRLFERARIHHHGSHHAAEVPAGSRALKPRGLFETGCATGRRKAAQWNRRIAGRKVLVFSNRTLREEAIRIFDRTFAITYALEGVAVFVAVMGVAGALLALVIDRRREFGLLRFLGARRPRLRRMILFEAGAAWIAGESGGAGARLSCCRCC